MKLYESQPDLLKRVQEAFGDYLDERTYHEEAGFVYKAGKMFEKALNALMKSKNFNVLFATAREQGKTQK
jgi:hypothetical protein